MCSVKGEDVQSAVESAVNVLFDRVPGPRVVETLITRPDRTRVCYL